MIAELKRAVEGSGMSRYRISAESGGMVSQSELSRWLNNRLNLGSAKLDVVAAIVGAEIVLPKRGVKSK